VDDTWYFLSPRYRKYRGGDRPVRRTADDRGRWKPSTGQSKPPEEENDASTSHSKAKKAAFSENTLAYYVGPTKDETKTKWLMHELVVPEMPDNGFHSKSAAAEPRDDMMVSFSSRRDVQIQLSLSAVLECLLSPHQFMLLSDALTRTVLALHAVEQIRRVQDLQEPVEKVEGDRGGGGGGAHSVAVVIRAGAGVRWRGSGAGTVEQAAAAGQTARDERAHRRAEQGGFRFQDDLVPGWTFSGASAWQWRW
jgi:hypothetical protein